MTITLELTLEEEQRLQQYAAQQGKDAREVALQAIKRLTPRPQPTAQEIAAAKVELFSHTSSLGYATGLDNEQIDADLAREYGDDHADLYAVQQVPNAA